MNMLKSLILAAAVFLPSVVHATCNSFSTGLMLPRPQIGDRFDVWSNCTIEFMTAINSGAASSGTVVSTSSFYALASDVSIATQAIAMSTGILRSDLNAEIAARIAADQAIAVSTTALRAQDILIATSTTTLSASTASLRVDIVALSLSTAALSASTASLNASKLDKTGTAALSITGTAGTITTQSSITASAFFGYGGNLTGISAGETNTFGPSSKTFTGNVLGLSSITASAFFGNGSGITGILGVISTISYITVGPSGAQYATVGAAVASIVDTSSRTVILISPATYAESAFTLPANVSLAGNGGTANLYFASGAAPAITISTESTQHSLTNITISQTSFGNVGLKIDGPDAAVDTFTRNSLTMVNSLVIGNPAIRITGTRNIAMVTSGAFGIFGSALVTASTGSITAVGSTFNTAGGAFDNVVIGGNNVGHRFRSVSFSGTAKAISAPVVITPLIEGVAFSNESMTFDANVVPASTGTIYNSALSVTPSTLAFSGSRNGGGYNGDFPPPTDKLVVITSSGMAIRSSGDGFISLANAALLGVGYANSGGAMAGVCYDGTEAAPTNCKSGSLVTFIGAKPYDGTNGPSTVGSNGAILITAAQDAAPTARGMSVAIATTLNGTTARRNRLTVNDSGRVAIAPRSNTITPLGLLHLSGTDNGISITGNGVSLYATEAIVSESTMTATGVYSSGVVSVGGGANLVYRCTGSTAGVADGNLNAGAVATACPGGTYVLTKFKVD